MNCKICGKRSGNRRFHDECIIQDCIATVSTGGTMTKAQYSRLYSLGYTASEFVEEYQLRRPVDWSKVKVDFITIRRD